MKSTIKYIIGILLVLVLLPTPVLAEDIGITPDSPLYVFKIMAENVHEFVQFDPDSKAYLKMEHAETRLNEALWLANKNGDPTQPVISYGVEVDEIGDINTSSDTSDDINVRLKEHIMLLEAVRDKAPNTAKKGLENAISNQHRKISKMDARYTKQLQKDIGNIDEYIENLEGKKITISHLIPVDVPTGVVVGNIVDRKGSTARSITVSMNNATRTIMITDGIKKPYDAKGEISVKDAMKVFQILDDGVVGISELGALNEIYESLGG